MIKESLNALGSAARDLFRRPRALLLLSALYAALLACVYLFFAMGVNTRDLFVSALAALAAPLLFLLLQAAAAHASLPEAPARGLARRATRDAPKVLLLALPVAALAVLCVYLLGKLQGWGVPAAAEATQGYASAAAEPRPVPLRWQGALVSSLWLLLLGVLLPLAAAHLWLSAAREGLGATLKGLHRVLLRAYAPRSVLVYTVGLLAFGLLPYFIVYTRTAVSNNWAELALFGLRLGLAFAFTLWGWAITLGGLARVTPPLAAAASAAEVEAGPPPGPAAAEPQLQASNGHQSQA
jgi:nitroreductase